MTDDIIHFMLDLMQIETADFNPTLSPLNPNYDFSRVRIVGGGQTYTKENGLN